MSHCSQCRIIPPFLYLWIFVSLDLWGFFLSACIHLGRVLLTLPRVLPRSYVWIVLESGLARFSASVKSSGIARVCGVSIVVAGDRFSFLSGCLRAHGTVP
jgi:hypothetical protein